MPSTRPEGHNRAGPRAGGETGLRIPGLDGFRAVSILLVMASHSGLQNVIPGVFGVTIFFFVSGFLITSLLLEERSRTGGIATGAFYMRRFLRLYPPLVVFIAITGAVWVAGGHALHPLGVIGALAYLANYLSIFHKELMQGLGGQLWSLAVEEHFYLVYPLLLPLLLRRRAVAIPGLLALCALSLVVRVLVCLRHPEIATAYTGMATECRIDAILFGAVTALAWRSPSGARFVAAATRPAIVAAGAGAILASFLIRDELFRNTLRYTIQEIALVPLVLAGTVAPGWSRLKALLDGPVALRIGRLSYALYLWHLAGLAAGEALLPGAGWRFAAAMAVGWMLSFAFAELSYRLVERPFFALRRRFGSHVSAQENPLDHSASGPALNRGAA
ncbi:peptidoglycan/LPS O-acetylase OafA/YrhL [Methylobacterium sp. BE186]|uniref:acyltransferase family protein n=1 Tax=Methylobacterium sp. BE186 TaxID=2817715 RepID=UPI00285D9A18|nr:acyltransferase [Methylobacterium sp. BE186]MDR7037936.1 peptidoglycan/LPS O-acetylase OafA/YrhL [Methylobacterium sp. BE186]